MYPVSELKTLKGIRRAACGVSWDLEINQAVSNYIELKREDKRGLRNSEKAQNNKSFLSPVIKRKPNKHLKTKSL